MNRHAPTLQDAFARMRRRIVRETEAALLFGVDFPERVPRIPMMEVGSARWHPEFAARFWQETLGLEELDGSAINARFAG